MRGNKKNKRIKNRLNILRELHLNKKRVKTVKKAVTTVTLEPYREKGLKVYKTTERAERMDNQWDAKIAIDQALSDQGIINLTWEG